MSIAIRTENLGKRYRLGEIGTGMLSEDLTRWWAKVKTGEKDSDLRDIWALRNADLEIEQGSVWGIIGRNGAGKSTFLKLLSKVTSPTEGEIRRKGRIASLLEVGTGFHPDMTGRENIFLNGAIMGMRKAEIRARFDEIVDFAGVERYIDTPVKRYSSGMYVRLAFAVAAHLEAEILLVDEVLAVGDAEFQKKCMGKMGEVSSRSGKTILFVSHNMGSIELLCDRCVLLDHGKIQAIGESRQIISDYFKANQHNASIFKPNYEKPICFSGLFLCDEGGVMKSTFSTDDRICITLTLSLKSFQPQSTVLVFLKNSHSQRLFMIEVPINDIFTSSIEALQEKQVKISLESNFLMPGNYCLELGILSAVSEYIDYHDDTGFFEVVYGKTGLVKYGDRQLGFVFPKYELAFEN